MDTLTSRDEEILIISEDSCDSGDEGDRLTSGDEGILVIGEGSATKRPVGPWWRAIRAACLGGAAVAVSLIVIFGIIAPAVRESRRKQCVENFKRIGLALHEYHEAQGHFPAPAIADRDGKPLLSWRVAILPQLGYRSLYEQFHRDEPWDSPHNLALLPQMPDLFACPGGPSRRAGRTGYLVVVGPKTEVGSINTPFEPTRGAEISEIFDGTSNTILVIETDARVPWTKPADLAWNPDGPLPPLASPHHGGAHVLFADGSVRFLKVTIEPRILLALLTKNGNEVISGSS
jgi:prepilin-type processing-associated H-X9-DG protein